VLFVGQRVGDKYRLLQPIGEGGMASVWSARHEILGRDVALKLAPVFGDPVQTNRFLREAQIIGQFEHPNIVNVLDAGEVEDQGYLFLAMELLRGKPFSAIVGPGRTLAEHDVLPILIGVCKGLEAAHQAGVVHRDVKPENVFLAETTAGTIAKLVDFGISLAKSSGGARITIDGQILGTPAYMSPEQARGKGEVDAAADIWAVGVMLYEALTGRQPFIATNYHALLRQILDDAPAPLPASVSFELKAIVLRCLEKAPSARYSSAAALRADLEAALESCDEFVGGGRATLPASEAPLTSDTLASGLEHTPVEADAPESIEAFIGSSASRRIQKARGTLALLGFLACAVAAVGAARGPASRPVHAERFAVDTAALAAVLTPRGEHENQARPQVEPTTVSTLAAPPTVAQRKPRGVAGFHPSRVTSPGF
jgi:eukaryotic-like serine/threonine-protein kinase